MKALIIGGGIAGPVTAMALARVGVDAEVFEAHDGPAGHLGLFLGLAANGLRVLRQLDLLTPVLAEDIIPTPQMRFDSTTGKQLATVPAGSLPDTPSFTIMRGALQRALAEEATSRGIPIRYGKRFTSCGQTPDGVLARFADGTVARGDLLVGADGIHSAVRSIVCPHAPAPSYTGLLNLGGVAHHSGVPPTPGTMRMVWGRRAFFGYTVRPDGEAWWFANVGREREPEPGKLAAIGTPEWRRILTSRFRDDPPELTRLVEATELIGATPIHDMPTLPSWHRDRAVVIGDAAHAVSPSTGQGASLALEDAVVLAKCLRDIHRPQAALGRFVELRRPRTERMVTMGRRRGAYKAPRNRATRFIRDLLMPLVFWLFATERSMSWIYDHEIRWDEPVAHRSPRGVPGPARAASLVALLLPVGLGAAGCSSGPNVGGNETFGTPLPIPPLLEGRLDESGRRTFELQARDGSREFLPGMETATRGINGPHLAPTLRMSTGDEVVVHLTNALDEATTMHWHGMELPAVMDGGPHQMIVPGSTWSPTWTVRQPSATLWYHPHPHGATEAHVYSGMVGMLIIDDEESARLELPSEYGVDDIPILVQDVAFDADGTLVRRKPWYNQVGPLGRTVLVNGAVAPRLELKRERVRLRLLNASVARVYNFGFSDDREFLLVASDGGLLAASHPTRRIQLSPGERADIVVRFDPGDHTVLRSFPQELNTDFVNHRLAGGNDSFEVMALQAGAVLEPSPDVPPVLTSLPPADPSAAAATRSFQVSSRAINGRSMDMTRIDARIQAGAIEIWEVEGIAVPHNLHIHGVRFRVLDVDGSPPPAPLAGWKDTVYLEPDRVTRLLIRFPERPDAVPFMFHCHFLRHEDDGAMGQFLVVGEG